MAVLATLAAVTQGEGSHKDILKAANENLNDLVPSRWEFRWGAPTQAVAVLATLAAVTHGEGVTLGHSERGHIIGAMVAQNQRSDCMEMFGNMVTTGDHVVGVTWERGISDLHHLGRDNG